VRSGWDTRETDRQQAETHGTSSSGSVRWMAACGGGRLVRCACVHSAHETATEREKERWVREREREREREGGR
jgi:hypothetical protein